MNFLVDNNLSPSLAIELKKLGYDSIHVRDRGLSEMISQFRDALEKGSLIIIESNRVRIKNLPF